MRFIVCVPRIVVAIPSMRKTLRPGGRSCHKRGHFVTPSPLLPQGRRRLDIAPDPRFLAGDERKFP
jgi:hypothetical protein